MNALAFWHASWTAALVNHLWQSTVVVVVAWLLALALRKNHARARYWVWMVASVKFLLPFALLIDAGEWLRGLLAKPVAAGPGVAAVMEQITQPFPQGQSFDFAGPAVAAHRADMLPVVLLAIWACGAVIVLARWARGWRRIRAAVLVALPLELALDVPVLATAELLEPGVFGVLRPVLLLPEGIVERLTARQLDAIIAHEMCHVRRRDNLTFAVHMVVEALFWFYPPVWWIGARLVEERERACDEAVVEAGGEAEVYAEGILNVCKLYVESPLECAAGVSGSDLKKRIVRIMAERVARRLDLGRKVLLGAAAVAAIAMPLAFGLVNTLQSPAPENNEAAKLPEFDVASIKPHKDEGMRMRAGIWIMPDGFSASGIPLSMFIREALGVSEDRVLKEPAWAKSSRYDIEAKVAPEDAPKLKTLSPQQRWEMLLPVLEDRFGLKFHHETEDLQVYTLVVAKGGPKLTAAKPAQAGEDTPQPPMKADGAGGNARQPQMTMRRSTQGMTMEGHAASMANLAQMISEQLGGTVVDKTGLTGNYDYTLSWMPDEGAGPTMVGSGPMMMRMPAEGTPPDGGTSQQGSGASLFTALQEQLGLKLEARKEPVDVIVIDQIEKPSPN